MKPTKYLQGICPACGAPIQFQADRIGQTGQCPSCGEPTELLLPQPVEEPSVPRKVIALTIGSILVLLLSLLICLAGLKHFQNLAEEKRLHSVSNPSVLMNTNSQDAGLNPEKTDPQAGTNNPVP
jgi:hypothetical protein